MSQTVASMSQQKAESVAAAIDQKFKVVVIPVSDVDRAKEFHTPGSAKGYLVVPIDLR